MIYSGDAMQWHNLTLNFDGPELSETPETFTDYRLDVTFTHESGQTITVPGYFAADGDAADTGATGGSTWRVHFNPPETGGWTWEASFRTGDNIAVSDASGSSAGFMDGTNGEIDIAPSDKDGIDLRAKGMLEYDGGQYLSFAGTDEVFLKSGVGSPENLLAYSEFDDMPAGRDLHEYAPHVSDFNDGDPTWGDGLGEGIIGAINYLSEHGVNSAYMLLMNIGGDGRDVSPWSDESLYDIPKSPGDPDLGDSVLSFDVSRLDQWEIVFDHMEAKGITLHLFLQEEENDQMLDGGDLGVERMLFMREMIARFGHHNGLIWNLGEETTNTVAQITSYSDYLKDLDPYDHPVALHTFPNQHNIYEQFEGTDTLDVLSFQTTNSSTVPDLDRYLGGAEDAGRPVVAFLDEPGSPSTGLAAEGDSGWGSNHDDMRETLYKFYAEGGSGAEWFFGYNTAGGEGGDLKMEDFSLRESAYEWAESAREFYEKLPLAAMRDGDDAISGAEAHGLALDGEIYAYYLPSGGSLTLDLSGAEGSYDIGWYDPIAGGDFIAGSVGSVSGGGSVVLGAPPSGLGNEAAVMIWNTDHYDFPFTGDPAPDPDPDPGPDPDPDPTAIVLYLVDTTTDEIIGVLAPGQTLPPEYLGKSDLTIVADVTGDVGSVQLTLGSWTQIENVAPYALFGDREGDYEAPDFVPFSAPGDYQLGVAVYSGADGAGSLLAESAYDFTVTDEDDGGTGDPQNTPPAIDVTDIDVQEDGSVLISAADVASDANGDALTLELLSGGANGTATQVNPGQIRYAPDADYAGADTISVRVSDGNGGSVVTTLEFDVAPVNDAPEAGDDSIGTIPAGGEAIIETLLDNDTDADGDALTITDASATSQLAITTASATTQGFFDAIEVLGSGEVRVVLSPTATGTGEFSYTVSDGNGGTDTGSVTLTATEPDTPPDPDTPPPPDPDPDGTLVTAINIGSKTSYRAEDGTLFAADYTGVGQAYKSSDEIAATNDDALYQTEAWGADGLSYDFALDNGTYDIRLHFADIWGPTQTDGARVFDVAVEGETMIDDLDIFSEAGANAAHTIDVTAVVEDGVLDIDFLEGVENPKLSALEIWQTGQPSDTPDDPPPPPDDPLPPPDDPRDPPAPETLHLSELSLVDADSNQTLIQLGNHNILHEGLVEDRSLSVGAEVDETLLPAESAVMSLDGEDIRVENVEPYALFGDHKGDYRGGLNLTENDPVEIGITYHADNGGSGEELGEDTATLEVSGDVMVGREGQADVYAFDETNLGHARITGFETSDTLQCLGMDDISELMALGTTQGDDLMIVFDAGNSLLIEGFAHLEDEDNTIDWL